MNVRKARRKHADNQQLAAEEQVLTDLFYDMYRHRARIYRVNFFRGLFFGLGSVLGGTVVIAIVVWLLSWLIGVPGLGRFISEIIENLKTR
jgi:TRAP-type mannitol/chloroaromatic compound transport system permease small subunit